MAARRARLGRRRPHRRSGAAARRRSSRTWCARRRASLPRRTACAPIPHGRGCALAPLRWYAARISARSEDQRSFQASELIAREPHPFVLAACPQRRLVAEELRPWLPRFADGDDRERAVEIREIDD